MAVLEVLAVTVQKGRTAIPINQVPLCLLRAVGTDFSLAVPEVPQVLEDLLQGRWLQPDREDKAEMVEDIIRETSLHHVTGEPPVWTVAVLAVVVVRKFLRI